MPSPVQLRRRGAGAAAQGGERLSMRHSASSALQAHMAGCCRCACCPLHACPPSRPLLQTTRTWLRFPPLPAAGCWQLRQVREAVLRRGSPRVALAGGGPLRVFGAGGVHVAAAVCRAGAGQRLWVVTLAACCLPLGVAAHCKVTTCFGAFLPSHAKPPAPVPARSTAQPAAGSAAGRGLKGRHTGARTASGTLVDVDTDFAVARPAAAWGGGGRAGGGGARHATRR